MKVELKKAITKEMQEKTRLLRLKKDYLAYKYGVEYGEVMDSISNGPPAITGISECELMAEKAFDVIFDGWIEYRTKIKGWPQVQRIDILDWEDWKAYLLERMEHSGTTNS